MRNYIERRRKSEKGFTLIELLVVIVILGILAAVVVFAVGGLNDKGDTSACKIDTRTLKTAEEAYFARTPTGGKYGTMQDLIDAKLLDSASTLHTITYTPADPDPDGDPATNDATPEDYSIHVANTSGNGDPDKCGTAPTDVDASATDNNI